MEIVEVERSVAVGGVGGGGGEWRNLGNGSGVLVVSRTLTSRFDWRVHGCFKNSKSSIPMLKTASTSYGT